MSKSNDKRVPLKEERGAEAITIAWVLCTLATVVGLCCALGAFLSIRLLVKPIPAIAMLPGLLLLISAVSGVLSLIFTPFVLKLRKAKPPRVITAAVLLVAATPLVLILAFEVFS